MRRTLELAVAVLLFIVHSVSASPPQPVELKPIDHLDATLTVRAHDGTEVVYTVADLEVFPTYRVTTATPWRPEPAMFEGVLLRDILSANGLDEVGSILVTAENDYTTKMTRDLWQSVDILVSTRVNGAPNSRRTRGPILFVIEQGVFESSNLTSESNLVWMAARIEADN